MSYLPNSPARVCMYAPTADGGHARYTCELLTALAQHQGGDFRYELVTSADHDPQFRSDLYAVHPLLAPLAHRNSYGTRAAWAASRVTHYLRRERAFLRWLSRRPDVDVVHLQEWTPWLAASLVRRIRGMGKRVVFTVHNIVPHKYPRLVPRQLVKHWIRSACRHCDGLFVHSQSLAEQLARSLGYPHPPIHVTPHGVWTVAGLADAPPLAERLKRKRLLFFGSIRRNKGLDLLLRAASALPDYSITVAGEPLDAAYFEGEIMPLVRQLRAAGAKLDFQDRFVDERELPGLFAAHSAVVLPYTAGFVAQSGVVFMALAHQVPVVCSEAGGLAELTREFGIGLTFKPPTAEALAAAVRELHESRDPAAVESQIAAARDKYSWASSAAATVRAYRSILQPSMETDDCAVATTSVC